MQFKKTHLKHHIRYSYGKNTFCCVRVQKTRLRVWLKLNYADLENPPEFVRDVSNILHYGVGDVEVVINSIQRLQSAKSLILQSFEKNRIKGTISPK